VFSVTHWTSAGAQEARAALRVSMGAAQAETTSEARYPIWQSHKPVALKSSAKAGQAGNRSWNFSYTGHVREEKTFLPRRRLVL
jgi:hypothetical protein